MARNLARLDPLVGWEALRRDLVGEGLLSVTRVRPPTTDVYTKDDNALIVEAHLPNFGEKDVTVTVDRGALVIQAERREKEEDRGKNYVVRESSSSFYRSIGLPDHVDESGITADFTDGVLTVTVPLQGGTAPRSIDIGSSTHDAAHRDADGSDPETATPSDRSGASESRKG